MALSQFGGRPSSGSGSAADGKEVGEVFLVPNTFVSSDVVEAGSTVTAQSQPTLFPKLVDGATLSGFVKGNFPLSDMSYGQRITQGITHNGSYFALTVEGNLVSTSDGINWVSRGNPIPNTIVPQSFIWPVPAAPSASYRATALLYSTGTRLVVLNTMVKFVVAAYSDDMGATWVPFSDPTMNTVMAANLPGTLPMQIFGGVGYAIMVDIVSKKIYRSTTGTSGWVDVTPAGVTFPTTASLNPPAFFGDASSAAFWFGNTMFASTNAGVTWTAATLAATTSAQYGLVSLIKWKGAMYCLGNYNGALSFYKSADFGPTYTASGSLTVAITAAQFYIGSDGNLGVGGSAFAKTVDGTTWTAGGAATVTGVYGTIPSGQGSKFLCMSIMSGVYRITDDYGVTNVNPGRPIFVGSIPGSISMTDIATNEAGLSVIIGGHWTATSGERYAGPAGFQGSSFIPSKTYYYGNFKDGWTIGQFPVDESFASITWNKYAGIFIASPTVGTSLYTSTDGINWTAIPATTVGSTVKGLLVRTFGMITAFIPTSIGVQAFAFLVGRGDGTYFFQKTAYTKAWPAGAVGTEITKFVEFAGDFIYGATTSSAGLYFPLASLLTSATNVNCPGTTTVGAADDVAVHGNTMVTKTAAGVITVVGSTGTGSIYTVNTATTVDVGRLVALWADSGVLTIYESSNANQTGGLRIRTSVDGGQTWSSAQSNVIASDEKIVFGRTVGDYVVLVTHRNNYILNARTGISTATEKTLATGWVAPAGLKYVVKAK